MHANAFADQGYGTALKGLCPEPPAIHTHVVLVLLWVVVTGIPNALRVRIKQAFEASGWCTCGVSRAEALWKLGLGRFRQIQGDFSPKTACHDRRLAFVCFRA